MDKFEIFTSMALALNSSLSSKDRYTKLLNELRAIIPFDAACLFESTPSGLNPIASIGLNSEAFPITYLLNEHPKLKTISQSLFPIIFPVDSELPDPFDGMLTIDNDALKRVHACLGCPLIVEDTLIGVLTADSLTTTAFDLIDKKMLKAISALTAATLRTSKLIEILETKTEQNNLVTRELLKTSFQRGGGEIIGTSLAILKLRREIELVARSDFSVLITGPTGSGKELVARSIHQQSNRKDFPLIYVNCAALPESIAESELFGHIKGSFTGAISDRAGKFEVANGGTLFLDEIGELPLSIQPKLLRILQEGEIQRVGSDKTKTVDVRIITATNRNLEKEVEEGRFRSDLFHRLNVFPVVVPALNKHSEDIPLLIGYFSDSIRKKMGVGPIRFSEPARIAFKEYSWPGNVRELKNILSRIILKHSANSTQGEAFVLTPEHLGGELKTDHYSNDDLKKDSTFTMPTRSNMNLKEVTEEFQRRLIEQTIKEENGNWSKAAKRLGLHRSNLHHLSQRLGLRD